MVKPGYKQTEVGVIPEDWDAVPFSRFVAIQRGHDLTAQERRRGDVPVMGSAGLNGFHDTAIKEGPGVVIGRSGASYGQTHWCETDFWPHNTALYVTDFLENDPRFAFYLLRSTDFSQHNSGGAQQSLNRNFIADVMLPRPQKDEQVLIRQCLDDVDAALAGVLRLIVKKRDLKQAAMQTLLTGQTRLPGFSGEWEVKRLGEVVGIRNHKVNTLAADIASFCIELEQIGQNSGRIESYLDARGRQSSKYIFKTGDVLFGRLRPYLRKYWSADREGVCSTEIWPLVPLGADIVPPYLFQTVQTDSFIEATNSSYGTHMPRCDWGALKLHELHLPPTTSEQTAIAAVLSDMDAEIAALTAQADKTRLLRQAMMQDLLTGHVRLPLPEVSYA